MNNKELSTSSSQMEKLLDSHFKRKMYPNYDYPKININNIVYSTEIKNKKEDTRNSFSFFYHNFELYEELFNFVDINDLKIQSYLFKEIDVSHKIVTSHIQVSFLNEVNSFYYKKFLRNKNINIIDNNEMSVIDISFIRNRISFENLLYHLIITILKLKLENNNIYILLSGRYFTEVLEQLGGIQLGIIPELEDNIYIYEVETIKLISHRYVINIIQSRNQYFSSI
ncbi:hypothetical protein [Aliivibrio fischeri]|uniref:hypothetical protein n=1 Tax=Aliivibrio fischeri TaxID=668 RepID=UPI0035557F0A